MTDFFAWRIDRSTMAPLTLTPIYWSKHQPYSLSSPLGHLCSVPIAVVRAVILLLSFTPRNPGFIAPHSTSLRSFRIEHSKIRNHFHGWIHVHVFFPLVNESLIAQLIPAIPHSPKQIFAPPPNHSYLSPLMHRTRRKYQTMGRPSEEIQERNDGASQLFKL